MVLGKHYMIAMIRRSFLGSILEDLLCLVRPSGMSSRFNPSFLGGAVTGKVGNELDQKGSNDLKNLWRKFPVIERFISFDFPRLLLGVSPKITRFNTHVL